MSRRSSGYVFLWYLGGNGKPSFKLMVRLVLLMVLPGILAQLSSVVMQYIDASMVGHLGSLEAASVGLVSSSLWLIGGMGLCINIGHYVQVSQLVGAGEYRAARNLTRQSYFTSLLFSLIIVLLAWIISPFLPEWLGGEEIIRSEASGYFSLCILSVPFMQFNMLSTGILQGAGSMKIPGFLNVLRCLLDVFFNFLLIFETDTYHIAGYQVEIFGFGLGVAGAALGTVMAEFCISVMMLACVFVFNPKLGLVKGEGFVWHWFHSWRAVRLALPIGFEHSLICLAMVISVMIVAYLGSAAVAAHSMAITAESFCYMAAYGISSSASAMMGQTIGAGRRDIARSLAWTITGIGVAIVSTAAVFMYAFAPLMMQLLTPDTVIQRYGSEVLRIVAFAEPLFASSIVISGILRGAGDTLIPSATNCLCMWLIRLPLSFLLVWELGLDGVWVAMSIQLSITGTLFLVRLRNGRWLNSTKKEDLLCE